MSLKKEIQQIQGTEREMRSFGLLVGSICVLLGLWFGSQGKGASDYALFVGVLLVGFGATVPKLLRWPYTFWMGLGMSLGFVMTNILLSLFFYLLLTPVALFGKLLGKSFLDVSFRTLAPTYWKRRPEPLSKAVYEKQF